jgi:hypothetical protein
MRSLLWLAITLGPWIGNVVAESFENGRHLVAFPKRERPAEAGRR